MECSIESKVRNGIYARVREELSKFPQIKVVDNKVIISSEEGYLAAEGINRQFNYPILKGKGKERIIDIPSKLIDTYIYSSDYTSEHLDKLIADSFKSMFSKASPNLMLSTKWLDMPLLENATMEKLLNFARMINPNFNIQVVDDLPVKAVSLIRDYMIIIKKDAILDELPEEIAHFFVELLPDDNPLKKELVDNIINFPIYKEVLNSYGGNKPNIEKIKREAAAKLISQYIKDSFENNTSKYGKSKNSISNLIARFIHWVRLQLHKVSPYYREPLDKMLDPYSRAAGMIVDGNTALIDRSRIPTIADSIFFSKAVPPLSSETNDLAKSLHQLSKQARNKVTEMYKLITREQKLSGLEKYITEQSEDGVSNLKLVNIMSILAESSSVAGELIADTEIKTVMEISQTAQKLAEAMREMEMIPDAMSKALLDLEATDNVDALLNNMTELKYYFDFTESFIDINKGFLSMISNMQEIYKNDKDMSYLHYEKLLRFAGDSMKRFEAVDSAIVSKLQNHVLNWTWNFTKETYEKEIDKVSEIEKLIKTDRNRKLFAKRIEQTFIGRLTKSQLAELEKISDLKERDEMRKKMMMAATREKLRIALTGKLTTGALEKYKSIADITPWQWVVYLVGPISFVGDPFVSSVMKSYIEKVNERDVISTRENIKIAEKVMPIMSKLMNEHGMNYYDISKAIQQVEKFSDFRYEDGFERRVFLDKVKRYEFFRDRAKLIEQINEIRIDDKDSDEDKKQKQEEKEKAKEALSKFDEKNSYRPFTDEYYRKRDELNKSYIRSKEAEELKKIRKEYFSKYEEFTFYTLMDETPETKEVLLSLEDQMADLAEKDMKLREKVPQQILSDLNAFDELFEVDDVQTTRQFLRHRDKWTSEYIFTQRQRNVIISKEQANQAHFNIFTIQKPSDEIKDDIDALWKKLDDLNPLVEEQDIQFLKKYDDAISILYKERNNYLKSISLPNGDRMIQTLISAESPDSVLLSKKLADIEYDIQALRVKKNIYKKILTAPNIDRFEKNAHIAIGEFLFAIDAIFSGKSYGKDQLKEAINKYFDVNGMTVDELVDNISGLFLNNKPTTQDIADIFSKTIDAISVKDIAFSKITKNFLSFSLKNILDGITNNEGIMSAYDIRNNYITRMQQLIQERSYSTFSSGLDKDWRDMIWNDIKGLSTGYVNRNYSIGSGPLKIIEMYAEKLAAKVHEVDAELINNKLREIKQFDGTVDHLESIYADNFFVDVVMFIKMLAEDDNTAIANGVEQAVAESHFNYIMNLHTRKRLNANLQQDETFTPLSYMVKKLPREKESYDEITGDAYSNIKIEYPFFVKRNKVRDIFRTKTEDENGIPYDDRHPDVIAGKMDPIIDINGQFLPKSRGDYYNKQYDDTFGGTDEKSKLLKELHNTLLQTYLDKQVKELPEGQRLSTMIPARSIEFDKFENAKRRITNLQQNSTDLLLSIPFFRNKADGKEEANANVELGVQEQVDADMYEGTIQEARLYEGAFLPTKGNIKLRSKRAIPIDKTSVDVLSSIMMFTEDSNEWAAKNMMAPVFSSFRRVFENNINPQTHANEKRAELFRDKEQITIYGIPPGGFANNPDLAEALRTLNNLSAMRLLGDPLGALVNFFSGITQELIEASLNKDEYKNFVKTFGKSTVFHAMYSADNYKKHNLSIETQFIDMLHMIPDKRELSHQMSMASKVSDIRGLLMSPRSQSELSLAIHLGLAIVNSNEVEIDGKKMNLYDLYEKRDGLIQLKKEYEKYNDLYNPVDGKFVNKIRNKIMQKYTALQGNFFKYNQSYISNLAVGKSVELMKRWFMAGLVRRWGDPVHDFYLEEERIPFHTAMLTTIGDIFRPLFTGQFDEVKDYFSSIIKGNPQRRNALMQSLSEMLVLVVFGVLILPILLGWDDDEEEKKKRLEAMPLAQVYAILIALRVQGELGTFIPLPTSGLGYMEMKRAIFQPLAIPQSTFDNISALLPLVLNTISYYAFGNKSAEKRAFYQKDTGYWYKEKGDLKLAAYLLNSIGYTGYTTNPIPYILTIDQMQNRLK